VLDAATVEFDAVLLGDEHEPGRADVDGVPVTYPGSTERTSASERDPRGYNVATFDGDVDVRRRGLDTRPFRFVDVELREGEGTERVRGRVREHDAEGAVVVVTVTGEGEEVAAAAVEELARERGALVARVNDRRDRETDAERPDVSFADPDAAVRERVRELGLSAAARDVDEAVRSSGLADSNVREEVKRRVESFREDDPGAFDRVPEDDGEPAADDPASDGSEARTGDAAAGDAESDGDGERPAAGDGGAPGDDAPPADADGETERTGDGDGRPDDEGPTADDGEEPADQASMEEYL